MSKRTQSRELYGQKSLNDLYRRAHVIELNDEDRYVIFSDLHMGNGGRADDFLQNSELFRRVVDEHYRPRNYSLVLNGDVEELQRFSLDSIRRRWPEIYELFDAFARQGRFYRLIGNHDLPLLFDKRHGFSILEAIRFVYGGDNIFVFHGHQTTESFEKHYESVRFILRYLATPLRIKNYEVSHNSAKRFRTERLVYDFATKKKILSIIGHTHRPLFESMSKVDSLKFEIERLCRKYPKAGEQKKKHIEQRIQEHKEELESIHQAEDQNGAPASLYRENLVVPCMFNSGCVLGKRGITALEIENGNLSLVHWFDQTRGKKYLRYHNYDTHRLEGTDYYRVTIKRDSLAYIMTRVKLLA